MTATEGGPALHGPDAAAPGGAGGSGGTARSGSPRLRTVLGLARVEAWLLGRSVLVLAGLLAGGLAIWLFIRSTEPLWWRADWEIGGGQLILGMTVLVAAQLAAGRPRRHAMADLYASFPATAGVRTLAHLIGLVGAVPASLLLLGAAAVEVQVLGPIGVPSIGVLAAGLLPRGGPAAAPHPHRRREPPGSRGRQPGLGAALHDCQSRSGTASTPASAPCCRRLRRRSTGFSRTCPPGLTSR